MTEQAVEQPAPKNKIHAEPTKDFFVTMITRDIALEDCIFDLLDNAIDGARRTMSEPEHANPFAPFAVNISFDGKRFEIDDNCGGILLSDAIDYAFHFGRRRDQRNEVPKGIGLYGIGMKRAIFKIGRKAVIRSEADDACFTVTVDVDKWEASPEWDFEYEDASAHGTKGTNILIEPVHDQIGLQLGSSTFQNNLVRMIAGDYSFFIDKGLKVLVNKLPVPSFRYRLRQSDAMAPAVEEYTDENVTVRLVAGLIDELPGEIEEEYKPEMVSRFGWYVVCNDRVVLAGDKSEQTIWGADDYRVWHPQYNGFAGFVFFSSDDQSRLPWTTTKRALDPTNPVYRRALQKMRHDRRIRCVYKSPKGGR
jgi:hypothetical protein